MNYSSRKAAGRAMRTQNLDKDAHEIREIEIEGKTRFEIVALMADGEDTEVTEHEPANVNEPASEPAPEPAPVKVVAEQPVTFEIPDDVTVDKPVAFVWAFLAANRGVERKKQIKYMVNDLGLNRNMTQTQTHRFYKVDGDKEAWLALEKAERDAKKAKIQAMAKELLEKQAAEKAAAGDEPANDLEAAAREAAERAAAE